MISDRHLNLFTVRFIFTTLPIRTAFDQSALRFWFESPCMLRKANYAGINIELSHTDIWGGPWEEHNKKTKTLCPSIFCHRRK